MHIVLTDNYTGRQMHPGWAEPRVIKLKEEKVDIIEKTSRSCLKKGWARTDIRAHDRSKPADAIM